MNASAKLAVSSSGEPPGNEAAHATLNAVMKAEIPVVGGTTTPLVTPVDANVTVSRPPGHCQRAVLAVGIRARKVLWPGVTFGNRFGKPTDSTETAHTGPLRWRSFWSETWKLALVHAPVHDAPVPWCDASRNRRFDE